MSGTTHPACDSSTSPAESPDLRVGGFVPFTTVDYPGKLAAVVFCQGCPWRCSYCHNPHLQPFCEGSLDWHKIVSKLERRRGLLDAVVFSGGEPTAQAALGCAMRTVRRMGFLAGLHTAGMYPERLRSVLGDVDWVGFDVKAPFDARYDRLTGRDQSADRVCESLRILVTSGVSYQVRTTLDPDHLDEPARETLQRNLRKAGAQATFWQTCRLPPDS